MIIAGFVCVVFYFSFPSHFHSFPFRNNNVSGFTFIAKCLMCVFDCTNTPKTRRISAMFRGAVMLMIGSKFLRAVRVSPYVSVFSRQLSPPLSPLFRGLVTDAIAKFSSSPSLSPTSCRLTTCEPNSNHIALLPELCLFVGSRNFAEHGLPVQPQSYPCLSLL